MQFHALELRSGMVIRQNLKPEASLPAQNPDTSVPAILPEWITDTFAAKYATKVLSSVGNTQLGKLVQTILNDPFVFLNNSLKIGGLNGSVAGASASVVASIAPSRASGTVVGAAVGALAGAGQAIFTFPTTSAVVAGAVHGLIRGSIAGNVAVLEDRKYRSPMIDKAQLNWLKTPNAN